MNSVSGVTGLSSPSTRLHPEPSLTSGFLRKVQDFPMDSATPFKTGSARGKRNKDKTTGETQSSSIAKVDDKDDNSTVVLGAFQIVLSAIQTAAQVAPLPFIKDAAGLAIELLAVVQEVQDNKAAFSTLAEDACGLVFAAMNAWKDQEKYGHQVSPDLVVHLGELLGTLTRIHQFANSRTRRNKLLRFVSVKADAGKISGYRQEMKDALDRFEMQSNVVIRGSVSRIEDQQQAILEALQRHNSTADTKFKASSTDQATEQCLPQVPAPSSTKSSPTEANRPMANPLQPLTSDGIPPPTRTPFVGFGSVVTTNGGTFTSIAGDHIVNNNSSNITSTNSGNVVNISTTNSHNNYNGGSDYGSYRRSNTSAPTSRRRRTGVPRGRHTVPM